MRGMILTAALLAAAVPAAAQHQHGGQQQGGQGAGQHQHDADHAGAHATELPEGWQVRLDRPGATAPVHFMNMNGTLHAVLGPAGIFYNPAHTATGAYHAQGTFTQNRLSAHPEAYGLMVGGADLQGDGQNYLYFIIRQDGKFMVKHRAGTETHTLVDWTEHAAVQRPDAQGHATNTLAVEAGASSARFLVNGTEVANIPGAPTNGIAGLRLNHNLDVTITDFAVHPAGH